MPRGRPRKVALLEVSVPKETGDKGLINQISEIIHDYCNIPGCAAKFHTEESTKILNLIRAQ